MIELQEVQLPKERFVLAVSGGVDSMVLLDICRRNLGNDGFIVAHFDHNTRTREEHEADSALIADYCLKHNLILKAGFNEDKNLKSEADLREVRYKFLESVLSEFNYNIVITAHHKDDLVETAILNILRGTNYRGLNSLANNENVQRPLLEYTKEEVYKYAKATHLDWNEDSSNQDETYLRNYIRSNLVPVLKEKGGYSGLVEQIEQAGLIDSQIKQTTQDIEDALVVFDDKQVTIERHAFILLDHKVATEIIRNIFNDSRFGPVPDKKSIDKIAVFAKTARNGSKFDLSKQAFMRVTQSELQFSLKTD